MGQEATVLELLGTFGNQLMLPYGWLEHFQFGQAVGDEESEDEESEDGDYVPHLDDLNSEEEEEEGSSEGDEGEGDGDDAPGTASAAADN
jgi:hypothetical protein